MPRQPEVISSGRFDTAKKSAAGRINSAWGCKNRGVPMRRSHVGVSKPVSRILSWTAICLGPSLPMGSSHLLRTAGQALCYSCLAVPVLPETKRMRGPGFAWLSAPLFSHGVAPDRVYSGGLSPAAGRALTSPFHPYRAGGAVTAVYLCCTCPEVAFGGRYPLSLPYGARTFLVSGLSACFRGCPAYSP